MNTLKIIILIGIFLNLGCGGSQPSGSPSECIGTTSYQEVSEGGNSINFTPGYQVGQYMDIQESTVITGVMFKGSANNVTKARFSIREGNIALYDNPGETPLKTFTLSGPFPTNEKGEVWLPLLEPYALPNFSRATTSASYYFFIIEALDGSGFRMNVTSNAPYQGLRRGLRYGTGIQWTQEGDYLAVNMGYQTPANCP